VLRIGGIVPFSTVDWPGKLVCVAFLSGCPWNCPYCQNPDLRDSKSASYTETDLFSLLEKRKGLLDGVVFSGGEPLAQSETLQAMQTSRELGFSIALHTCGAFPDRLKEALPYLDWVGLDIKAPWNAYDGITGVNGSDTLALRSLNTIISSGVDFEIRTTWHPDLLSENDICNIALDASVRGVKSWAVQAYRHQGTNGLLPNRTVYPSDVPNSASSLFDHYEFRRA